MWLSDRLSAAAPSVSPSPQTNRSFSPAARRPSHLAPAAASQRPGFAPRNSSLSAHSNDSSSSLLASSKRPNGYGLKQSVNAPDVADPLEVLGKLLGAHDAVVDLFGADAPGKGGRQDGEEFNDTDLDFEGLSLREIVSQEVSKVDGVYGTQTIQEYEREKSHFEDLHKSIQECDDVLNSVELNLTSFQNDLAQVSAEIETLQARSTALSVRLDNRKRVESALGPVVEEISIAPVIVRRIVEGPIDEAWVKALAEVEKRSKALNAKTKDRQNIKGIGDLKPLLEDLVGKALERIRDFLVAQIKALRSPNINAQIIQQQHFVRYKDLYAFLHRHNPQLAVEIAQAYMNTMRWYFLNQFTRYKTALDKVRIHHIDKTDVLGADDGTRRSNIKSGSKATGPPHDAFNLGRRIDLLRMSNQPALPSFLAEEDKTTHYLEFPFRNFNLALLDNASTEYSFLTTFFSPVLSLAAITRHFNYIFEPTFSLGSQLTKTLVFETYDCLGILLCVRLNQHSAFELQRRKIPAMDGYINGTNMLLWPRFQSVMDAHCASIQALTSSLPTRKPSAAEVAKQSAAPHFMTQRFGHLLQGILTLSTEAGDDEPVSSSLGRLRSEIEVFLGRLGKGIGDVRKRERFLFNNYSLILTIIGDTEGKLASDIKEHFEGLKKAFGDGD